jgi:DNA-directed RNA polymerase specialized sigma24 family protein
MTALEIFQAIVPVAIAAARNVLPKHLAGTSSLHTDPDFLQSVRLRAWRAALHALKRGRTDDLVPFACVIGHNAGHDYLASLKPLGFRDSRKRRPSVITGGGMDNLVLVAPPDPDPFAADDLMASIQGIDLTPLQAEVIQCTFAFDLSHREIANRLGISVARSKHARRDAVLRIRGAIA